MTNEIRKIAPPFIGVSIIFLAVIMMQVTESNNSKLAYTIVGLISMAIATTSIMPTVSKISIASSFILSIYFVWLFLKQ